MTCACSSRASPTTRSSCSTRRAASLTWNPGARAIKGYAAERDHRPALLDVLPARGHRARASRSASCEIAAARGPRRGRGLAAAQGRHALLGQRRHHGAARRRAAGCAASPRSRATCTERRLAEEQLPPERGAVPAAGRSGDATTRSSCSIPSGHIATLERGRRADQGLHRRGDHRPALLGLLPAEDVAPPASRERELRDRAQRAAACEDEGWRVRKDGSRFWANVVITRLRDARGELRGFAKVTRD